MTHDDFLTEVMVNEAVHSPTKAILSASGALTPCISVAAQPCKSFGLCLLCVSWGYRDIQIQLPRYKDIALPLTAPNGEVLADFSHLE
jgi:hypothetical protein